MAYLVITQINPLWCNHLIYTATVYENREEYQISDTAQALTSLVCENTNAQDRISIYGNYDLIYILANRLHATKYSYQFPIGILDPTILKEYFSQLAEEQPPIIIVDIEHYDTLIQNFLNQYDYQLLWASNTEDLNNGYQAYLKS